ncbi:hypothetical protein BDU57DRAFT_581965 [Ampelomyces quisqualis]|uniref:gamma-glutamylcyclotransferase n=1 Tax=Ampelomyces quisqualis TaxID=50730 RepID=A0A6A5QCN4_AMPQU|nr:hypothetical protein BDU57DRAFT_581965 [Ampelomyces quisqualis]
MSASSLPANKTIYFGYGSNLWLHQMSQRCPTAQYLGVARLTGYKWIISARGYANIVETQRSQQPEEAKQPDRENQPSSTYDAVVFGLVYSLEPSDEANLDRNEGVPIAYTKEYLPCDFWPAGARADSLRWHRAVDGERDRGGKVDMLVYIDRERVGEGDAREEYVYRMNRGVDDAVRMGVPGGYVVEVIRRFIREDGEVDGESVGHGEAKEWAEKQARGFRDESGVF